MDIEPAELDYLFRPRSIAVVGVSTEPTNWASVWLKVFREFGFEGELYPVNPRLDEISGQRVYSSVKDIPGSVDYVVVYTPAQAVPQVMKDCVTKGVRFVHIFSAGFGEIGDEEGIRLEAEVVDIARGGGVRVVGPNCMGVYCPSSGLSWRFDFPKDGGHVAFFSQSGWNAADLIKIGSVRGIRFSKLVSYGNACDLNEADLLEYYAADPETRVIAAYIEGVRDGQRFFRSLGEATKVKPVIILKGGCTEVGARAVASHTGSLAGTNVIWDSLLTQVGATGVYSVEQLADTVLAFLYLPPPQGRDVAIISGSGGVSVQAADECGRAGLTIPPLPLSIRDQLRRFTPEVGTSLRNPVESPFWNSEQLHRAIEIVAGWEQVAILIVHVAVDSRLMFPDGRKEIEQISKAIISVSENCDKSIAVVLHCGGSAEAWKVIVEEQERCRRACLPVYHTIGSAVQAIGRLVQYHQYRDELSSAL